MESLLINQKEVDVLIRANLYSDVASDEIDLASHILLLVIHFPLTRLRIYFEEQYGTGGSDYQSLVEQKVHVTKIFISHFLQAGARGLSWINSQAEALSVECKDILGL